MSSFDTHCLFSTVRNVSGKRKLFGFLPPHGRQLDDQEEMSIFGNVLDAVAVANGGDRNASKRWITAFEAAINRGDLIIVKTPNPILQDTVTDAIKMLSLASGTLGVLDPCWHNTGSIVEDERGGVDFEG